MKIFAVLLSFLWRIFTVLLYPGNKGKVELKLKVYPYSESLPLESFLFNLELA
jgi:hypothetical protein